MPVHTILGAQVSSVFSVAAGRQRAADAAQASREIGRSHSTMCLQPTAFSLMLQDMGPCLPWSLRIFVMPPSPPSNALHVFRGLVLPLRAHSLLSASTHIPWCPQARLPHSTPRLPVPCFPLHPAYSLPSIQAPARLGQPACLIWGRSVNSSKRLLQCQDGETSISPVNLIKWV